jgi:cytochrome b561
MMSGSTEISTCSPQYGQVTGNTSSTRTSRSSRPLAGAIIGRVAVANGIPITYTRTARALHWLTAVLLLVLFGLGLSMTRWIEGDWKLRVYSWHEWTGLTVFAATSVRLLWRLRHPPPPNTLPRIEHLAASLVHGAIYLILLVQPVVGWLTTSAFGFTIVYLNLIPLPSPVPADRELAAQLQTAHFTLAMALAALVAMHVGAVAYHHLVRRDATLHRMAPGAAGRQPAR